MTAESPAARTSISDVDDMYLNWVRAAVDDHDAFLKFRQSGGIQRTVENVKPLDAQKYREVVLRHTPDLLTHFERFTSSDALGQPDTVAYPEGAVSPTTWRYIKVLSDLQVSFGSLDDFHIVEIGGGYGGQCKIIADVCRVASYTIYDLEPVQQLAIKFLRAAGSPVVEKLRLPDFRRLGEVEPGECDLVISNWAFSECSRPIQDRYIDHVLRRATRGYVTYNHISSRCGVDSYKMREVVDRLGFSVNVRFEELSNEQLPEPWQAFVVDWNTLPTRRQGAEA